MCLLTVVIPTKNRQKTALYAVDSVLRLGSPDTEVIVHDCGDTDSLAGLLQERFGADPRIKYHYIDHPISMTDNWNAAFLKSRGTYVCGIGDDDAVMPAILDLVRWMEETGADAALPLRISYVWQDAYVGQISSGRVTFPAQFDGGVHQIDIEAELTTKTRDCGFGYDVNLPNLYHGVIRKEILLRHQQRAGAILAGTSLDAYASFAFSGYVDRVYYVDYPITIRGVCGASNSNRIVCKKSSLHFKEFDSKKLSLPDCLPPILNSDVSITESCMTGLRDTGRTDLLKLMDLSVIYGKCAANEPHLLFPLYRRLREQKTAQTDCKRFFKVFAAYYVGRTLKLQLLSALLFHVNRLVPIYDLVCDRIIKKNRKIKADDIAAAVQVIESFADEHGIVPQFKKAAV